MPPEARLTHAEVTYKPVKAEVPTIPDTELIDDDALCMTFREPYLARFAEHNVHRRQTRIFCRAGKPARDRPRVGAG